MNWAAATSVELVGDGRFRARVDEDWTSLQGVHGGIVAALALRAAERVLRDEGVGPATTLRSATFGYVSGNSVGDLTIDVELVRRGRAMVTTHVRTVQCDKTTTVARFHHSAPWDGLEFSDAPPMPTKPARTVRLEIAGEAAHLNNVETHLHPDTTLFAGGERAEWIAWARPIGGATFDTAWLTMFGDYFPPAVFTRATTPQRALTIEYSIQIHCAATSWSLADDEFLAARMHTFHSHDGFAVEDGWIYLPDRSLLATVRQTRLAG
jgi:acyl-coenzyme A thioesterase PaaI-like protein